jgi:hypothetical protein
MPDQEDGHNGPVTPANEIEKPVGSPDFPLTPRNLFQELKF